MKSSIELKELRNDIISELEVIKLTATAEERDLTSDENNDLHTLLYIDYTMNNLSYSLVHRIIIGMAVEQAVVRVCYRRTRRSGHR